MCSTVIGYLWMNELAQIEDKKEFLKISGILSISTLLYNLALLFVDINVKGKKIKPFIFIQYMAAVLCFSIVFLS